jgi:hypothetical protein
MRRGDKVGKIDCEQISRRIKLTFVNQLTVKKDSRPRFREVQVVTIGDHMRGADEICLCVRDDGSSPKNRTQRDNGLNFDERAVSHLNCKRRR